MKLKLLLLIGASALQTSHAFMESGRNITIVASKEFVNPILSKDVITNDANLMAPKPIPVPSDIQSQVDTLEISLGAASGSTQVDVKSGKVELLTLSTPILPGKGLHNRLLWTISSDTGTAHTSPTTTKEWEAFATKAVMEWMMDHASELQIDVDNELFAPNSVRTAVHGDGDMIQLSIPRIYKGIPVVGARAMATIKLGNLINVGLEDWGDIPDSFDVMPTVSMEVAYDAVAEHMGLTLIHGMDKCEAELQILTLTTTSREFGKGYDYVLAWKVCPLFEGQDIEVMEGLVDAQTGQVYSFVDKVHYLESKGGVFPISNDGRDQGGTQQAGWPMAYMNVGNEVTDTGGNYLNTGSVTASFSGPYVMINDRCGSSSLSSSNGLVWGTSGGTDCTTPGKGGSGNTHSARTNFYELNKVMEVARSHLPGNSWLKQRLKVNVNHNDSCNAWWSNTINFYRRGNGCGNTGELAGVIIHEWGHGLDDNDIEGSISSPSGEGIADIYAALRMSDSCIGRGFFLNRNGCTGVRNIDYMAGSGRPKTFSNNGCGGAVHCLGGVYSEAIWSLYKRFLQTSPYNYDDNTALEIVTRLTFIAAGNVRTWFSGNAPWGGCGSASGYREYLAADDDNGNLNDGTPHMRAIYNAFNEHEIACNTLTAQDSGCSGTPIIAPLITVTPGNMQAIISWTAASGASNYQVFRSEGDVKKCNQGKVKLTTTTSLSFTDTGLMNGRDYYYVVIPKGPNDSCFGPSSSCMMVKPTEAPVPTTPSPTKKPSPPTSSPTNQPTKKCGNGFCDIDEHSASCQADCANVELDVRTNAGRGAPGIMFWIKADSRDIALSGFKFFTWETTSNLIQIYSRIGKYTGFELSQTGWELVYEETTQLSGDASMTEISLTSKVTVSSDETQSFFIWIDGGNMKYDAGTVEGAVLGSDSFIEFYEGVGITSKFAGSSENVWSPRIFSGIVSYEVVQSTSNPTMLPTAKPVSSSPSKNPVTSLPTNWPTQNPSKQPITSLPTPRPVSSSPSRNPIASPSTSPSNSCGNGTCEAEESSTSCSQDCSNIILNAHESGKSGAPGVMFDMTASRDVVVKSFEFYTDAIRNDSVEVYTRPGSFEGFELDEFGWTLVFNKTVDQMGRQTLTDLGDFDIGVTVRAGTRQSFFIVTNYFMMYDKGSAEGQVLSSDASLTVYEGVGVASKFPSGGSANLVYSPRLFKGNIRYDAIRITGSPTKAPTSQPSNMPLTTAPRNVPTHKPSSRSSTGLPSKTSTLPMVKQVRLHAITHHPLNMREVEIYSSGMNVAEGKMAFQSSTLKTMDASKAVDGKNHTFSHTTKESTFSWWQVDLGGSFPIESVTILNRYCRNISDPNGCLCRLSHAVMTFFDERGQWVATTSVGNTCNQLEWTYRFDEGGDNSCSWKRT